MVLHWLNERDLETVVNHVPLNRFVLLAHTLFGHVAIRFATRNLHRVEALILNCSVSMRMRPGATVINQEIADKLVISLTTVRRHVSNIFDKTGAGNRAQATAYAKDHGLP